MLSIRDALQLHKIIAPHIPGGVLDDDTILDVSKEIVNSMRESDPKAYLDTILLMSKKTIDELQELDSIEILNLFIRGLIDNQIILLDLFGKRIGLKYG